MSASGAAEMERAARNGEGGKNKEVEKELLGISRRRAGGAKQETAEQAAWRPTGRRGHTGCW